MDVEMDVYEGRRDPEKQIQISRDFIDDSGAGEGIVDWSGRE